MYLYSHLSTDIFVYAYMHYMHVDTYVYIASTCMCIAERENTLNSLFCQINCSKTQEVSVASLAAAQGLVPTHQRGSVQCRSTLQLFLHQMGYTCNIVDLTDRHAESIVVLVLSSSSSPETLQKFGGTLVHP